MDETFLSSSSTKIVVILTLGTTFRIYGAENWLNQRKISFLISVSLKIVVKTYMEDMTK